MKKLLFLPLLAALLLAACGDSEDDSMLSSEGMASLSEKVNNPLSQGTSGFWETDGSALESYYEPDTLTVLFGSQSQRAMYLMFDIFLYNLDDEWASYNGKIWGNNEPEKFNRYAKFYGDTVRHDVRVVANPYVVCTTPLNSISITADKDFDSEHPAGSLLNDLFVLEYASYYNLIQSGYDSALDISLNCKRDAYQQMPLSKFEPLSLLDYNVSLYFTKLPDTLGEYTFTITFEYGTDPVSGKEAKKVAPAVVKAVFTEADYVCIPKRGKAQISD